MKLIYLEKSIKDHPRTIAILQRFKSAKIIECEHYGEIFNLKAQNFRLQKQNPALILAEKKNNLVLPTPEGFGIGGEQNYYFSHMLNCIYDCRYCFLQGMYRSANYVVFVNYEDFQHAIEQKLIANTSFPQKQESSAPNNQIYFFSGYDADSLAYEPVTGFVENFLPFFAKHPQAILELRSKSCHINSILKHTPIANCVIAFSFTPSEISVDVEHKVPPVQKRIAALQQLARAGWQVGLRLDPLIYQADFERQYQNLVDAIFKGLDAQQLHSVSVGPMRFPVPMYQRLVSLYPKDRLLAQPLQKREQQMSYPAEKEQYMKQFVLQSLARYIENTRIFECNNFSCEGKAA